VHNGQRKLNLRCQKEGGIGRTAGKDTFLDDGGKQLGRCMFGKLGGREFQIVGPPTLKLREPSKVRTNGTKNTLVTGVGQLVPLFVLLILGRKCTLAESRAAPW